MSRICLCCGKRLDDDAPSYWHASCIRSFFGRDSIPEINIDDAVHDELAFLGLKEGRAVPGVQKKLTISLEPKKKTFLQNGEYIIKTVGEWPLLPEWEFVGMKLASLCRFKTVPNGLVYSTSGSPIYISRRIDRGTKDGRRVSFAMEDFAQLSKLQTEYKYNGSYERCVTQVIAPFSATKTLDRIEFFRMVFFCYLIGNTDMHLKNFSLLNVGHGYSLAPFYDILPVMMVVNQTEMALTVHGKNKNLTRNDFIAFARTIGLGAVMANRLMDAILAKVPEMIEFLSSTPLPKEKQSAFASLIRQRSSAF